MHHGQGGRTIGVDVHLATLSVVDVNAVGNLTDARPVRSSPEFARADGVEFRSPSQSLGFNEVSALLPLQATGVSVAHDSLAVNQSAAFKGGLCAELLVLTLQDFYVRLGLRNLGLQFSDTLGVLGLLSED